MSTRSLYTPTTHWHDYFALLIDLGEDEVQRIEDVPKNLVFWIVPRDIAASFHYGNNINISYWKFPCSFSWFYWESISVMRGDIKHPSPLTESSLLISQFWKWEIQRESFSLKSRMSLQQKSNNPDSNKSKKKVSKCNPFFKLIIRCADGMS